MNFGFLEILNFIFRFILSFFLIERLKDHRHISYYIIALDNFIRILFLLQFIFIFIFPMHIKFFICHQFYRDIGSMEKTLFGKF